MCLCLADKGLAFAVAHEFAGGALRLARVCRAWCARSRRAGCKARDGPGTSLWEAASSAARKSLNLLRFYEKGLDPPASLTLAQFQIRIQNGFLPESV